jgi:two-component system nitrogen regulation response regulator GlnG/two-component system response regulator HydG
MLPPSPTLTLPEDGTGAPGAPPGEESVLALAIAWYEPAPERIGEVATVTSSPRVLGRGEAAPDDPVARMAFARDRGGAIELAGPLSSPHLSRVQLVLREGEYGSLHVRNVGRLRLFHRGKDVAAAVVSPGEILELGAQLVLVVVHRPKSPPRARTRLFDFGEADASGLVGESAPTWALRDNIAFVGPRGGHVLVHGASGTGKELIARALHAMSARAQGPLVARNAATFPDSLIDAELFGHARNYPNAGVPERPGLIGEADQGTLFLDEFAELSPAMQAHLLRVLDSGEYQRLGDPRVRHSSFRLVAATNRPLNALKHDVLARLTHRIDVPDLGARLEDVPLLARHLLRRIAAQDREAASRWLDDRDQPRFATSFVRAILTQRYTANVRQLEGILWRALRTSRGERLEAAPEDAAAEAGIVAPFESGVAPTNGSPDTSAERVQACLDENNGVLEATWRALGLPSRHALARLVKKHGLEVRRRTR